jgi:hypothetical protein
LFLKKPNRSKFIFADRYCVVNGQTAYNGSLLPLELTRYHPKPQARRPPLTTAITGEIGGELTGDCWVSLWGIFAGFSTISSLASRFVAAATVTATAGLMSSSPALEKEENATARSSNERVSIDFEDETAILF